MGVSRRRCLLSSRRLTRKPAGESVLSTKNSRRNGAGTTSSMPPSSHKPTLRPSNRGKRKKQHRCKCSAKKPSVSKASKVRKAPFKVQASNKDTSRSPHLDHLLDINQ